MYKKILISVLSALMLVSCKEDETETVICADGTKYENIFVTIGASGVFIIKHNGRPVVYIQPSAGCRIIIKN